MSDKDTGTAAGLSISQCPAIVLGYNPAPCSAVARAFQKNG